MTLPNFIELFYKPSVFKSGLSFFAQEEKRLQGFVFMQITSSAACWYLHLGACSTLLSIFVKALGGKFSLFHLSRL